jgi:hypothetical protein
MVGILILITLVVMLSIEYLIFSELYKTKGENTKKIEALNDNVERLRLELVTLQQKLREENK